MVQSCSFLGKSLFTRLPLFTRGGVEDTRLEAKDTKKSEAKAKDSLSEDRPSRGQEQECSRPRTKNAAASVFKKKRSSKKFFRRSPIMGVPRIFDWERSKPQITYNDVIKNFYIKKEVFVGQKYRRMKYLKSLPVGT